MFFNPFFIIINGVLQIAEYSPPQILQSVRPGKNKNQTKMIPQMNNEKMKKGGARKGRISVSPFMNLYAKGQSTIFVRDLITAVVDATIFLVWTFMVPI